MIVIQHNIDVLDRRVVGWLETGDGGKQVTVRDLPAARAHRRARPRVAHRRALLEVIRPSLPRIRGTTMLVIQRPTVEAIGDEDGNRQRFAIGPLEPGFGHTIGNSLRRTLLSSHPRRGHHDGPLRRRAPRVRHHHRRHRGRHRHHPEHQGRRAHLDVRRGRHRCASTCAARPTITAGDIKCPSEIEILNKDLHIATLNAKGRLAVDLTVEPGRGYLSSDRETQNRTIGVIPIDAIFSPVRRVMFEVEPTRVEQTTNYDRLVLDIETDGSITPREALASAGATLRSLVDLVANLSDEPQGLELGEVASTASTLARPRPARSRTSICRSAPATA